MRIAFITPEFTTEDSYSGGLANYLGRVTTALADRGHDVHCFTKSFAGNQCFDHRGVTVHRVVPLWDLKMRIDRIDRLTPRSLYAPYQDLKACWSLWKRWKQEHRKQPFDIVQVANVLAVGLFFRNLPDVPVVTRLSSFRPVWDTAFGVEVNRSTRCRWWMEKVAIKGSRHVYAPTHYVARLTKENYAIDEIQVIETPFHNEEPDVDNSEYELHANGRRYLLFFGRMTMMKGAHLLARALPTVLQQNPDLHAIFVGNSGRAPDGGDMREYILQQTAPVADRVTILESMRHDKLYPIVKNAHLVVLPSLLDNLPNTCLEAMALGRPVVATTGTCFEQLITDGESGILVEPDSTQSLEHGLQRALALSHEARQKIGAAAKQRIAELHPDHKVPELLAYFESLIDQNRPQNIAPVTPRTETETGTKTMGDPS